MGILMEGAQIVVELFVFGSGVRVFMKVFVQLSQVMMEPLMRSATTQRHAQHWKRQECHQGQQFCIIVSFL